MLIVLALMLIVLALMLIVLAPMLIVLALMLIVPALMLIVLTLMLSVDCCKVWLTGTFPTRLWLAPGLGLGSRGSTRVGISSELH